MLTQTDTSIDENGIAIVKFSGRLTLGSSLSLAESKVNRSIEGDGVRKMVLDLTDVEHADSAGLGFIVYMHGKLHELGGQLRLAGPNPRLRELFKMTRTEGLFEIDPDPRTSVEQLKA